MKFDHNFTQTTATPTGRTYAADGWQAQLDFLSGSCLRVALYRNAGLMLGIRCTPAALNLPINRGGSGNFSLFQWLSLIHISEPTRRS